MSVVEFPTPIRRRRDYLKAPISRSPVKDALGELKAMSFLLGNANRVSLPSSSIHRWKMGEGSGTTTTDSIGSADGTLNGNTSWISSADYQEGNALDGDGNGDYVDTGTLGSFGSNLNTDFAVSFTIDSFDVSSIAATDDWILGVFNTGSSGNIRFEVPLNIDTVGDISLTLQDASGTTYSLRTDSGHVGDNSLHRVLINKVANSGGGGVEFYVADKNDTSYTQVNSSEESGGNTLGSTEDFTDNVYLLNANGLSRATDATIDDVIIYDDSLSASERSDDLSLQPAFG